MLVDNCAMQIIRYPAQFDVINTHFKFIWGYFISDELSVLSGSLGMMPSASFNSSGFALYEPAGGSAPDIANKDAANPIAQILSAGMMLAYSFALHEEARTIEQAIKSTIISGYRTSDISLGTPLMKKQLVHKEFTKQVIKAIQ